jgi:hydrogenase maturation protease
VRLLAGRAPADVELLRHAGEATTLLDGFAGAEALYLIDAAASGAPPGTVRRFDAGTSALPSGLAEMSSHGFGLAQAIELARALGSLPPRCIVYAIEGARFDAGAALSPAVVRAAATAAERILAELTTLPVGRGGA